MRIFVPLMFFVILTGPLSAQSDDVTRKLQIAQNLERAGEWKQATVLYEDLFRSDTTNYVFFDALRRAYAQLKEYDKAIDLVERRIRIRPAEFYLSAFLGGVYFDAGRRNQADSIWAALLQQQSRTRQMYVLVAQQMQERRLFGRAIETYRKGRTALANDAEFAQELAMLHSATQAYGDAVGEYILLLIQTPHQLGYVQSRIASFTIRDEGLRQAEAVAADAVGKYPGNIQIKTLYAWILMEQGRYGDALPVYRDIDAMSGAKGQQLYSYAGMAVKEGYAEQATQAYADIITLDPPSPLRAQALYGMAEAYEKMGTSATAQAAENPDNRALVPESSPPADSALSLYARVIEEYPGSQMALQSLYRIGIMRFERQFDLDGARRALADVRTDRRAGHLAWEALLTETDILVAAGDVTGALALLESAPQQARLYLQDRFILHQARLTYYLGGFERAAGLLTGILGSLNKDAANDALELSYHLQDAAADSATLIQYAKGEVLFHQRKYAEALGFYERVGLSARTAMLASRARVASADMLVLLDRPLEAIHLLDSVVSTYQTDVLRDRALFRMGILYEDQIGDRDMARRTYEKFLVLFPTSIFADEARRRARALGKDPL